MSDYQRLLSGQLIWGVLVTIVLSLPLILLGVGFSVWSWTSLSFHDRGWLSSVWRIVFSFIFCWVIESLAIVKILSAIFPSILWCFMPLLFWLTICWSIRTMIFNIWVFLIQLSPFCKGRKFPWIVDNLKEESPIAHSF